MTSAAWGHFLWMPVTPRVAPSVSALVRPIAAAALRSTELR